MKRLFKHTVEMGVPGPLGTAFVGMFSECELDGDWVSSLALLLLKLEEHGWVATVGLICMVGYRFYVPNPNVPIMSSAIDVPCSPTEIWSDLK